MNHRPKLVPKILQVSRKLSLFKLNLSDKIDYCCVTINYQYSYNINLNKIEQWE